MTQRRKKLLITQFILLITGLLIIFFTYYDKDNQVTENIISKETQEKIKQQVSEENEKGDIFFNIEYSGLDVSGNRYILKSKEAFNSKENQELVNIKSVEAIFYFKDGTVLNIWSNYGEYNNKTLDMKFEGDVKAIYEESRLFSQKAEYSNSKSFLIISENVKIEDIKGTMFADELYFDIKKQKLKIASYNDGKINTNINLK